MAKTVPNMLSAEDWRFIRDAVKVWGLDSTAAPAPVSGEHVHVQAESPAAACGTTGHPRAV